MHARYLREEIATLTSAGKEIVLVTPIPTHGLAGWDLEKCSIKDFTLEKCRSEVPFFSDPGLDPSYKAAYEIMAVEFGAVVVDFSSRYCGDDTCSTHVDGQLVYRDAYHLSSTESKRLTEYFDQALATK